MTFRMSHDGLHRRPSRRDAAPSLVGKVLVVLGVLAIGAAALDLWLTDGRCLRFLLTDGMRPFRTMFDGLRVKGL